MANYWEIGFEPAKDDLYFASPEADFAIFVEGDLPGEGTRSLMGPDIVMVRRDSDDYVVLEGAYNNFVSFEWPDKRNGPSMVHGLEGIGNFGNLIVGTRIIAFILFYYEAIAASRLYYVDGKGRELVCLADHLKELEDEFLNEHDHPTKQAINLFRASVRQDEILQNRMLDEIAAIYEEEEKELAEFDEFEDPEEYDDDFEEGIDDSADQDDSGDFIYRVAAQRD